MSDTKYYITCKSVFFYSVNDEAMFFDWIKRIGCIKSFEGARDELYLDLVDRELTYDDIKDLIALLYRYKIDMKQLAALRAPNNERAFIPWEKQIFGKTSEK